MSSRADIKHFLSLVRSKIGQSYLFDTLEQVAITRGKHFVLCDLMTSIIYDIEHQTFNGKAMGDIRYATFEDNVKTLQKIKTVFSLFSQSDVILIPELYFYPGYKNVYKTDTFGRHIVCSNSRHNHLSTICDYLVGVCFLNLLCCVNKPYDSLAYLKHFFPKICHHNSCVDFCVVNYATKRINIDISTKRIVQNLSSFCSKDSMLFIKILLEQFGWHTIGYYYNNDGYYLKNDIEEPKDRAAINFVGLLVWFYSGFHPEGIFPGVDNMLEDVLSFAQKIET